MKVVVLGLVGLAALGGTPPTTPATPMSWAACPDVDVAPPDAAPLVWQSCGDGCEEIPFDGPQRLFGALGGTADDGAHWLAFVRDQGAAHELDIYRGDAAEPVFAARMMKGFGGCIVRPRAVGERGVVIETTIREQDGHRARLVSEQPSGNLLGEDRSPRSALEVTVSNAGARASTSTRTSLEIDGVSAWTAPSDGTLIAGLVARTDGVAFTAVRGDHAELDRWTRAGGLERLADDAGGAAGDARDLVWFARDHEGRIGLFHDGKRLRDAHQDFVDDARGVVGEGFALHVERARQETAGTLILTRISDGVSWVIPPRAGARWGTPLWVDRNELAIAIDADADGVRAGRVAHGESRSIVRIAHAR